MRKKELSSPHPVPSVSIPYREAFAVHIAFPFRQIIIISDIPVFRQAPVFVIHKVITIIMGIQLIAITTVTAEKAVIE